jgi:hypothetical protein
MEVKYIAIVAVVAAARDRRHCPRDIPGIIIAALANRQ